MERILVFLFYSVLIGSGIFKKPELKTFHINGSAQGTTWQITWYSKDSLISRQEIETLLARVDSSLSIYKPWSLISQFNSSPRGVKMDRFLADVVKKSLEVYHRSDGKFDITVYPLVRAWGFGTKAVSVMPDPATISRILACVGSDKIMIRNDSLLKAIPCVQIDVNGIAQGYTADVMADYLEGKKISRYLVEIGGELRIKGRKPDGHLMKIGIESPAENALDAQVIRQMIQMKSGAITTSGNYRKFIQAGNQKISHLINPKSGYSLHNRMISATVIAKDGITSDGYDNVLMAMEPEEALDFIRKHREIEAYLIYRKDDGTVADTASAGFYRLLVRE